MEDIEEFRKYSEEEFYEFYKVIRNYFRKFDTSTFVIGCLDYIHRPVKTDIEQLQKRPWSILLLIKWAIADEQSLRSYKKIPSSQDIFKALQILSDFEDRARLPTEYDHIGLFVRNVAYQQFLYQDKFRYGYLARQFIMFESLPPEHFIKTKFQELTGLSIENFLELSLLLFFRFSERNNHEIDVTFFSTVGARYSREQITKFLQAVSISLPLAKTKFIQRHKQGVKGEEFYEQTPFLAFPLIENGNKFLCTEQHILFRTLEHFIYDRMRNWDAQKFTNEFGFLFERTVEQEIQHMTLSYSTEADLKRRFGGKRKIVDFVINDQASNVFIDAKAVEMSYQGKVAHLAESVQEKSSSILKAIEQANDTVLSLEENTATDLGFQKSEDNYLIVVTYKELHLSSGKFFYNAVAKKALDELREKYSCGGIPLENMYFLTIDEFSSLSAAIEQKKIGLVEALNRAKEADAKPETMKFDFKLHLKDWGLAKSVPDYLHDKIMLEIEKIQAILP